MTGGARPGKGSEPTKGENCRAAAVIEREKKPIVSKRSEKSGGARIPVNESSILNSQTDSQQKKNKEGKKRRRRRREMVAKKITNWGPQSTTGETRGLV